jgi:hypothetical protein
MPDLNLSRVNGTPYSWHSCAHFFNGLPYKGIVAANWEEEREVKIVHAGQQDGLPLGITAGRYMVKNVTFRLLTESAQMLMLDLTVAGLGSYGDAQFSYSNQLFEPSLQIPPAVPSLSTISGCRITGVKEVRENGVDELVTEFTCAALFVTRLIGGVPAQLWSLTRSLLP